MEQVSIYLRYISGGVTKETFIGYSLRPSKTGTALVHYYFFSLAGPRDKQVVFAIRAKLGLTPQMDVRPYAYGRDDTLMYSINQKLIVFEYSRCSESNTTIHSRIPLIECASECSESLAHSLTCNDTANRV